MNKPTTLRGITWNDLRGYGPFPDIDTAFATEIDMAISVRWHIQPLEGFESRPLAEIADRYDLLVMDHPHVASAARQRLLQPIEGLVNEFVGRTFESYRFDGRQWAVPIDGACHVAAYRPGVIATCPDTWDDVLQLIDGGIRVALPLAGVHSLLALLSLIAAQGVAIDEAIDWNGSHEAHRALRLLKQICQGSSRRGLEWNPIDALGALADDQCDYLPLTFGYAHWQARGIRFGAPPKWTLHEASRGVLGGAGLAVSANCGACDLAHRYARFCGSATVQREIFARTGGQPAHREAWNALSADPFYRDTRDTIESAFVRPQRDDWNVLQQTAGDIIECWLRRSSSEPEPLLHDLGRLWQDRLPFHKASPLPLSRVVAN